MDLIVTDRVWAPVYCFGVQGFQSNDLLAFSFHGGSEWWDNDNDFLR